MRPIQTAFRLIASVQRVDKPLFRSDSLHKAPDWKARWASFRWKRPSWESAYKQGLLWSSSCVGRTSGWTIRRRVVRFFHRLYDLLHNTMAVLEKKRNYNSHKISGSNLDGHPYILHYNCVRLLWTTSRIFLCLLDEDESVNNSQEARVARLG